MKNILYILLISMFLIFGNFMNYSCKPTTSDIKNTKNDSILELAKNLNIYFAKKDAENFFKTFPNKYEKFNDLYGYDDVLGKKILYDKYPEHINFLFNNGKVKTGDLITKSISLSICTKWEADANSFLQKEIRFLIKNNTKEFIYELNNISLSDNMCFWIFLLDNSIVKDKKNKEFYTNLYNKVKEIDVKQAEKMKDTFLILESQDEF